MVDRGSLLHRVIDVNDNGRSDAPTAKDALGTILRRSAALHPSTASSW
jgi:hypothetical protein